MKQSFSPAWKSSKQPRKQRKYQYNAPEHTQAGFLTAHLDKPLRERHGRRALRIRKGDKVKILRGSHKGKDGRIDSVDITRGIVYIEKMEITKKDGTKRMVPFRPSNLLLTDINLDDRKRKAIVERTAPKETRAPKKDKPKQASEAPAPQKTSAAPAQSAPSGETKNG